MDGPVRRFTASVTRIAKQEGTFSALVFGCCGRGFDSDLLPYPFAVPPIIWGFRKNSGYVLFDEEAYFRTTEESYKEFCAGSFAKEREEAAVTEEIAQERVPESAEECIPYLQRLALLYGKLLGVTVYAEALHEPFAERHYEGEGMEEFFSIATLPGFETFTMRRLRSALAGDAVLLRAQSAGYYLAPAEEGLIAETLGEYENPEGALKGLERERERNEKEQRRYRKTLSPPMQRLFDYIRIGARVRDRRKDALGALCVLLTDTAKRILASLRIDPALAPFCHYADFDNGIPNNYAATLREREKGFAYISYHDKPRREVLESYEAGLAVLKGRHPLVERFLARVPAPDAIQQEGSFSILCTGWYDRGMMRSRIGRYLDQDPGPLLMCYKGRHGAAFFDWRKNKRHTVDAYRRYAAGRLAEQEEFRRIAQDLDAWYAAFAPADLSEPDEEELCARIRLLALRVHDLLGASLFSESLDEEMVRDLYREQAATGFDEFLRLVSRDGFASLAQRRRQALLEQGTQARWTLADYVSGPPAEEAPRLLAARRAEEGGAAALRATVKEAARAVAATRTEHEAYLARAPSGVATLFRYVQLVRRMRDERSDLFIRFATLLSDLVRELFRRRRLPEELLPLAYYEDFPARYREKGYVALLRKRSRGVCKYVDEEDGALVREWSFDYDRVMAGLAEALDATGAEELSGRPASPGVAEGPARIIISADDFHKFEAGDVLVTSMTRPEFVPLMRKAAAIVTDEGGLTCHAAIVSRELGKPCVIGVQRATRQLRDGQRVRVDAGKGSVTMLGEDD